MEAARVKREEDRIKRLEDAEVSFHYDNSQSVSFRDPTQLLFSLITVIKLSITFELLFRSSEESLTLRSKNTRTC